LLQESASGQNQAVNPSWSAVVFNTILVYDNLKQQQHFKHSTW